MNIAAELTKMSPSWRRAGLRVAVVETIVEGELRRHEAHWGVSQVSA